MYERGGKARFVSLLYQNGMLIITMRCTPTFDDLTSRAVQRQVLSLLDGSTLACDSL